MPDRHRQQRDGSDSAAPEQRTERTAPSGPMETPAPTESSVPLKTSVPTERTDPTVLVAADDLGRMRQELARLAHAADDERSACRRIVEDQLRTMIVERRTDPVMLVRCIIARIDERAAAGRDAARVGGDSAR